MCIIFKAIIYGHPDIELDFGDLLSTMINTIAFCVVFPALTLHVYVPASLAAKGLNVSVLAL